MDFARPSRQEDGASRSLVLAGCCVCFLFCLSMVLVSVTVSDRGLRNLGSPRLGQHLEEGMAFGGIHGLMYE